MINEKINLTRDEVVLVINSVQRQIIMLENKKASDQLIAKHRRLLGTLLVMESQLKNTKKEPLNYYK
mgnify:FL=1